MKANINIFWQHWKKKLVLSKILSEHSYFISFSNPEDNNSTVNWFIFVPLTEERQRERRQTTLIKEKRQRRTWKRYWGNLTKDFRKDLPLSFCQLYSIKRLCQKEDAHWENFKKKNLPVLSTVTQRNMKKEKKKSIVSLVETKQTWLCKRISMRRKGSFERKTGDSHTLPLPIGSSSFQLSSCVRSRFLLRLCYSLEVLLLHQS